MTESFAYQIPLYLVTIVGTVLVITRRDRLTTAARVLSICGLVLLSLAGIGEVLYWRFFWRSLYGTVSEFGGTMVAMTGSAVLLSVFSTAAAALLVAALVTGLPPAAPRPPAPAGPAAAGPMPWPHPAMPHPHPGQPPAVRQQHPQVGGAGGGPGGEVAGAGPFPQHPAGQPSPHRPWPHDPSPAQPGPAQPGPAQPGPVGPAGAAGPARIDDTASVAEPPGSDPEADDSNPRSEGQGPRRDGPGGTGPEPLFDTDPFAPPQ